MSVIIALGTLGVRNHASQEIAKNLDINFIEGEVELVLSHFLNNKSYKWDGLTIEFVEKYVLELKSTPIFGSHALLNRTLV